MSWLISKELMQEYESGLGLGNRQDYENSRCSQGRAVESLEGNCSAGVPCAPSSASPMPQAFLPSDRMTDFSRPSRFGMTFGPLTDALGADLLTWFLEGFHVKTSARRDLVLGSPETEADSGWKWPESSVKYDHSMRLWKTRQFSLLADSEWFSETWPRWGTMRAGECWELPMSVRPTCAKEYGLWPTPTASDHKGATNIDACKDWKTRGTNLPEAVQKTSGLACSADTCSTMNFWENMDVRIVKGKGLIPTPSANDFKGSARPGQRRGQLTDPAMGILPASGKLNPTWVEWLMGWPLGWTDLRPSATARSRSAPLKPGDC